MNLEQTRVKLDLNQTEFWGRVGVTQSGGSRYESGRRIPKPVKLLLDLAYGSEREHQRAFSHVCNGTARRGR